MFALANRIQGLVAMALYGTKPSEKFMLWIDAVGGYWVCLADEIVLGQPSESGQPDVPILADISGRHARIRRDGENYLIDALRDVRLDGHPVRQTAGLADGDRIELGEGVRLALRRPHPLSATVRLNFLSRHRTQPPADAVLLMAQTCVLGPKPHSHVVCRDWTQEVILVRQGEKLFCHAAGPFEIDGVPCRDRGLLLRNSRVAGEGFSFSLESIDEGMG
jgi:hypothetical protein